MWRAIEYFGMHWVNWVLEGESKAACNVVGGTGRVQDQSLRFKSFAVSIFIDCRSTH